MEFSGLNADDRDLQKENKFYEKLEVMPLSWIELEEDVHYRAIEKGNL